MASVFTRLFGLAMRVEREQFLSAEHYDRVYRRRVYANGYKSKRVDTPAGALSVSVSKTSDHLEGCSKQFFLQSMERRRRFSPAVILAVAVMYIKGISTRDAEAVMKEFGIESLTSIQISRVKNFWLLSYKPSTTDSRAKYAI